MRNSINSSSVTQIHIVNRKLNELFSPSLINTLSFSTKKTESGLVSVALTDERLQYQNLFRTLTDERLCTSNRYKEFEKRKLFHDSTSSPADSCT
jgi:hypothetical protein